MASNAPDHVQVESDKSTTDEDDLKPSSQSTTSLPPRASTPRFTPRPSSQRSPGLARTGDLRSPPPSSLEESQLQAVAAAHRYRQGLHAREHQRMADESRAEDVDRDQSLSEREEAATASLDSASAASRHDRSNSLEEKDNSETDHRRQFAGSMSWAAVAAEFASNVVSKYDAKKSDSRECREMGLLKAEPGYLKDQSTTRLKQEYDSITTSSSQPSETSPLAAVIASLAAAATGSDIQSVDLKEGQLHDLLLFASSMDLPEESASKLLLQLAAQRPEIKNLLTSGSISSLLQQHLQRRHQPHQQYHHAAVSQMSAELSTGSTPHSTVEQCSSSEMLGPNDLFGTAGCMSLPVVSDGSLRPKKIRHKKRVNGQKICLVCGDRALAHNFDVITCESCKAFFRRNALKSQNLQRCMFQNSCVIDKNTRRFCPSCRLKKCFDIGMKPELMLDEEERRLRQEKKAQRIKRQVATSSCSTAGEDEADADDQVVGSSVLLDHSSRSYSPEPGTGGGAGSEGSAALRIAGEGYSPLAGDCSSNPELSRDSPEYPSPLPSFHTLRDPVTPIPTQTQTQTQTQASSSSPTTPTLPSSSAAYAYGGPATARVSVSQEPSGRGRSPRLGAGGRTTVPLPAEELSGYTALLGAGHSAALQFPSQGQHPQHQQLLQQQQQHYIYQPAPVAASRSPRASQLAASQLVYHSSSSYHPPHHPSHLPPHPHPHHQLEPQQPPALHPHSLLRHRHKQEEEVVEEEEMDDTSSQASSACSTPRLSLEQQQQQQQQQAVLLTDSCPYPLPGPAARIFTHVPRDKLPSDPFMYWIVSAEERLMLSNLTIAYQDVLLTLNERGLVRNVPIADSYFLGDFLNEIDDAMYKIVQFSKHIADFRQMRKEDQIAMLKSSAMQTLGIALCSVYVHERDCWLSLRGDLTLDHLKKLTNDDPYIQVGVEYCRSVKSLVKNDFTVYALIHCMILFDPRDAKIVDRQLVNQTRDKFVITLKHYLEWQFSYLYADEYFVAIQDRVREMCHLAQSGNALFRRYSSAFQPLITEMLSSV